jgi:protein-L-isoaspartate(D-aspartate) O-methyltransferase
MEYPNDHYKLIEDLKTKQYIKSKNVARVMKEVDRADFTDLLPYTDCPSPIGYSTSIAAPHMHAMILVFLLILLTNFPGTTQGSLNR